MYKDCYQIVTEVMERLPKLIIFLNLLLINLGSANAHVKSIFIFGDSLFDAGNNRLMKNCKIQANFTPYGSTFFNRPTGRFTNGRTVADFIAQYMGIQLQQPFEEVNQQLTNGSRKDFPANGINFASGGSGVLADTNTRLGVTALQVQTNQLQGLVDKKHVKKEQIQNSMFFISSGSNDIFSFHLSVVQPALLQSAQVDKMLKEVSGAVEKLCTLGARKIAFFEVGPMGCIPAKVMVPVPLKTPCNDLVNTMVKLYNTGLGKLAGSIPKKFPGVICVLGAMYNFTLNVQANAKVNGFANIKEACCGAGPLNGKVQCGLQDFKKCSNPSDYFFWDHFHPTEHAYELLSRAVWEGDHTRVRPMNIKALADTP